MRTLPALATLTVAAKVERVRAWAGGWLLRQAQAVVVVDRDLQVCATHPLAVADAALSDDGGWLVIADATGLRAVDATGTTRWHADGAGLACLLHDEVVWTAQRLDRDHVELALRGRLDGEVRRSVRLVDRFHDATVWLLAGPRPGTVVVWFAAGQDGQACVLVSDAGAALVATAVPPDHACPPAFAPSGDAYLAVCGGRLELRAWPGGEVLDECRWGGEGEDDVAAEVDGTELPGDHVDYLPGGYGVWSSQHGRLYVLDLAGLFVVDEVVIDGHPLVPAHVRYPTLVGDDAPCSDFQFAARGPGGRVLTVHGGTALVVTRLADWSVDPARRR